MTLPSHTSARYAGRDEGRRWRTSRAAGVAISAAAYVAALVVAVLVVRAIGSVRRRWSNSPGHPRRDGGDLRHLGRAGQLQHVRPVLEPAAAGHRGLLPLDRLGRAERPPDPRHRAGPRCTPSGSRATSTATGRASPRRISATSHFRRRFGRLYWPVSFLGIHLFPTIMVFLGCLPMYAVATPGGDGAGLARRRGDARHPRGDRPGFRRRRAAAQLPHGIRPIVGAASARACGRTAGIRTTWGRSPPGGASGSSLSRRRRAGGGPVAGAAAITAMFVFVSVPMMEKRALATRAGYRGVPGADPDASTRVAAPAGRRRRGDEG